MKIFDRAEVERMNEEKFNDPKNSGLYWTYRITNMVPDDEDRQKEYYGATWRAKKRQKEHANTLRHNKKGCKKLYAAMKKHGVENFFFELMNNFQTEKEMDDAEIANIRDNDSIKTGYNITPGGKGVGRGKDHPMFGKFGDKHPAFGNASWTLGKFGSESPSFGLKHSDKTKMLLSHLRSSFADDEASHIKMMIYNGAIGNAIRLMYDISDDMISRIRRGKAYNHILPSLAMDKVCINKQITDKEAQELWDMWRSGQFTMIKELQEAYAKMHDKDGKIFTYKNIQSLINGETFAHIKNGLPRPRKKDGHKISPNDAIDIKQCLWIDSSKEEKKRLAIKYNLTEQYVYDIQSGRRWGDILPELHPKYKTKK